MMYNSYYLERPCPICRAPEVIAVLCYPDLTFTCTNCLKDWRVGGLDLDSRLDKLFRIAVNQEGADYEK